MVPGQGRNEIELVPKEGSNEWNRTGELRRQGQRRGRRWRHRQKKLKKTKKKTVLCMSKIEYWHGPEVFLAKKESKMQLTLRRVHMSSFSFQKLACPLKLTQCDRLMIVWFNFE